MRWTWNRQDRLSSVKLEPQEPMDITKVRGKPVTFLVDNRTELSAFKSSLCQKATMSRATGSLASLLLSGTNVQPRRTAPLHQPSQPLYLLCVHNIQALDYQELGSDVLGVILISAYHGK